MTHRIVPCLRCSPYSSYTIIPCNYFGPLLTLIHDCNELVRLLWFSLQSETDQPTITVGSASSITFQMFWSQSLAQGMELPENSHFLEVFAALLRPHEIYTAVTVNEIINPVLWWCAPRCRNNDINFFIIGNPNRHCSSVERWAVAAATRWSGKPRDSLRKSVVSGWRIHGCRPPIFWLVEHTGLFAAPKQTDDGACHSTHIGYAPSSRVLWQDMPMVCIPIGM